MQALDRRNSVVDAVRVLSIVAVIAIHTLPFQMPGTPLGATLDTATVINQLARFAVPFFFVVSGFFWAAKFGDAESPLGHSLRTGRRIGFLFFLWSLVYLLPTDLFGALQLGPLGPLKVMYWHLVQAGQEPLMLLLRGTKIHLWFFPSLLSCMLISAVLLAYGLKRTLVAVAVALYVLGLLGKAYADTHLGFHTGFNFRNGPFFGLIYFVAGYLLQRQGARASWFAWGLILAVAGCALHFTEIVLLNRHAGTRMEHDFVLGTLGMGLGFALMALSNVGWLRLPALAAVGPLVLGIYASHYVFVDLLRPLSHRWSGQAVWELGYVVLVFLLSLATASALGKFRWTRRLVN